MQLLKLTGQAALLIVGLFVFLLIFSSYETRYRCSGNIASLNETTKEDVFLKLQRYRWWVGLWNKSVGDAWLEAPNRTFEYYSKLQLVGDVIWLGNDQGPIGGSFSTLSNALQIDLSKTDRFSGMCVEIKR